MRVGVAIRIFPLLFVSALLVKRPPGSRHDTPVMRLAAEHPPASASSRPPRRNLDDSKIGEELEDFLRRLPELERVRDEVRDHPHEVPQSLLEFARTLALLNQKARIDAVFSQQLMASLENCVKAGSAVSSVRALCLRHSRQVANMHPAREDLLESAKRVRAEAPGQVQEIAEALDNLS